jgi:hypothetical protein
VGLYTGTGGATTKIEDSLGAPYNNFASPSINQDGRVAFNTIYDAGNYASLSWFGGTMTTIANSSGPVFSYIGDGSSINESGTVAAFGGS